MKSNDRLWGMILLLTLAWAGPSFGQGSSDEVAVWTTVERQWRAEKRGDTDWVEELLSGDFVGWPKESPAPQNKTSTRLWNDFDVRQGELLEFELYPQSIIVHGDMAVVHYLYTTARQPKGGDVMRANGRYTDVLVRSDDGWLFVAWHGGDD